VKPALASRLGEARVQRDQAAPRTTALLGVILRQGGSRLHAGLFDK